MDTRFTAFRQCIRNSNSGFTLIELLTATVVSLAVSAAVMSLITYNRQFYTQDQARNTVNQNLRAAMELVGTDIKEAGEQLTDPLIPVIQVSQDGNNNSVLTLYKSVAVSLPVCSTNITANSTINPISVANAVGVATPPACVNPPAPTTTMQAWQTYRQGNGNQTQAYITDNNGHGEFFPYDTEDTTNYTIHANLTAKSPANWQNAYNAGSTIYLMETRQYSLNGNILQVIINGTTTQQLVNNIQSFQVSANVPGYTPPAPTANTTTFPINGYNWKNVAAVQVTIGAVDPYKTDKTVLWWQKPALQVSGQFYPRNILSK